MGLISRPYTAVAGQIILASGYESDLNTVYDAVNGQIDDDNVDAITEGKITFNTSSGHKHTGSDSAKIDNTGAGFILRGETTGTDHALIGRSSSTGAHAGVAGIAETATAYGGYFNSEHISGLAILAENTALGTAIKVTSDSITVFAEVIETKKYGLRIVTDTNSQTDAQALSIHSSGTAVVPPTDGFVEVDGTNVANTATKPLVSIFGVAAAAGTAVVIQQDNTGADGPTGGAASDEWVLKVVNNAAGAANANALLVDGYTRLDGNVRITGDLSIAGAIAKGSGTFEIDHPLSPRAMVLRHSFVESNEMKNIYDGVVQTNGAGEAEVYLPEWFLALNCDFRYQATVIGHAGAAYILRPIGKEGSFAVGCDLPFASISWQITGVRKDAYALAHPLVVEELKKVPGYLHPEVWQ